MYYFLFHKSCLLIHMKIVTHTCRGKKKSVVNPNFQSFFSVSYCTPFIFYAVQKNDPLLFEQQL